MALPITTQFHIMIYYKERTWRLASRDKEWQRRVEQDMYERIAVLSAVKHSHANKCDLRRKARME